MAFSFRFSWLRPGRRSSSLRGAAAPDSQSSPVPPAESLGSGAPEPAPPRGVPPIVDPSPSRAWFEAQGLAVVERNRYFVLNLGLALALIMACAALALMAPLKTVVPFVLERAENGAVTPAAFNAEPYQPAQAEIRYFIAQWVRQLMTIDPHLTSQYLAEAYRVTRGKAPVEFTDWIQRTQPMAELRKDPTLTRTVNISSVSLIEDQAALVRVSTERRNVGNPMATRDKFVLTLHFTTRAPASEAELLSNPAGLYITHFLVTTDLEK